MPLLADVRNPATYRRAGYLLIAFPLGIVYFTVLITGLSTGVGLAITVTGIPILIAMLYLVRVAARLERYLLGELVDVPITEPYRPTEGQRFWAQIGTRVGDPASWRDLFYLLLSFPLSTFTFAIFALLASVGLGALLGPLYFWAFPEGPAHGVFKVDSLPLALALVPVGAVLVLLALRAVHWLAELHARLGRLMLGSNDDPQLTARVVDLTSSRARMIAAADAERRRLERDLHDGAQQRLVSLSLTLSLARKHLESGDDAALDELLGQAGDEAGNALQELRDLARGLHPAILTNLGLGPALEDLARRSKVPAEVTATPERRLPDPVEATAYFVVSEALTNVAKYAEAQTVSIAARVVGSELVVEIADDGKGGAVAANGSGISGLDDRLCALDGRLEVDSPPGAGTRITARMPADANGRTPAGREVSLSPEEREQRMERSRLAFRNHATVAAGVNAVLVLVWALTSTGYVWPVWPLLGWGTLLAVHGWLTFGHERALPAETPRAGRVRALRTHAALYGILNALLVAIWLITTAGYFWPIWPALGLGLPLAIHAWVALGTRRAAAPVS